ncbi:MAG: hypothetical protein E6586_08730 [Bifidobacterium scardovii]|jgi:hypothetical protein|uniref:hypothetical protein n=1 Tax=Bifidobacterium scardovii TaxID=158787 RepID=UPI00066884C3|nr:hypothetical protein [Bifidobacterium scardovii]DAE50911.1 MAG TPA: hypothetical protein [Caudoviricetes sp.]MDU3736497.1 hypothetical protein [Bifidobacterium scardovii]MDU5296808.1 hypothetical protein [Bifidobacterium scardovii]MDU5610326.1 hypothetical protein [Bifidobacterium scardovii]MDU5886405.1 hypothetical protein [Bifidobacterium scardovii]
MGKPRINVTDQWIQQNVLANPGVRKALNATARRLLPIAKRIAYKEHAPDYADSLRIETGTRPGTKSPTGVKRPYARVIAGSENAAEQEFGGKNMPKRGFLRRAAAELGESVAR